jgi:hypothetical protein
MQGSAVNEAVVDILTGSGVDSASFRAIEPGSDIVAGEVPGHVALALWQALRRAFPRTGVWPIIHGDPAEQDWLKLGPAGADTRIPAGSIRDVLDHLFVERCALMEDLVGPVSRADGCEVLASRADEGQVNELLGRRPRPPSPWPTDESPKPLELGCLLKSHGLSRSRETLDSVAFGLVPVSHPYEVAVRLNFGGWNFRPEPGLNAAVLREWGRTHSAVPACISGAVMECVVERPPTSEQNSFALAAQQWIYCEDIVVQGTYSIRALAIELWRSPTWYFWWD